MLLNSLEPDQARTRTGFVGDDLDPNFFVKKVSADDASK